MNGNHRERARPGSLSPEIVHEWLDQELEGELPGPQRAELAKALAADPALEREHRELAALTRLLAAGRVRVRHGFAQQVVKALPAAGWEARHPRSWRLAVALLLLLGGASAALVGAGSARLAPATPFLGAVAAVGDLFRTAALAGAGMLAASWKGVGLAMQELTRGSWLTLGALGLVVVSLNVLLFLQVRSSRRQAATSVAGADRDEAP